MKNIPSKIYLNLGFKSDEFNEDDFDKLAKVTWCKDKVDKSDIEYLLKSEVDLISKYQNQEIERRNKIIKYFYMVSEKGMMDS